VKRGEIWLGSLDPTVGREQAGTRPFLIVSHDYYNDTPTRLAIVLPLTGQLRRWPLRVRVSPPEGNLSVESDILCDQVGAVDKSRLNRLIGSVSPSTLRRVSQVMRDLLDLNP
jgi:mRNA interferase MazF